MDANDKGIDAMRADATANVDASADAGQNPVDLGEIFTKLPVEVLGEPGTTATIAFDLDAAAQGATTLHLSLFNIVAADSARVWVNRIHPIDLSAADGPFVRPAGGTAEGVVTVDPAWLSPGRNHLTFEYTRQVPDVSGFRVLAAAVRVDGQAVFELSDWVDVTTWAPFDDSAAAIARGKHFFTEVSRDGGPFCATCHAGSGADLQYYGFSNRAIVARAMFHKFSRAEAKDIASYIRSLAVPIEGRVWIPPFQPGPGNVGAAGAGLDAVLASDAAFGAGVFGAGGLPDDIAWGWPSTQDTFVIPAAIQLPTWFRWLPREIDPSWFERDDRALAKAEAALAEDPSLENAHAFMSTAVAMGKDLLVEGGDHKGRIELLRFAAVKLWDFSRKQGFYDPDHGFPNDEWGPNGLWGSPPYPYEVGFAFFEAALAGIRFADFQTVQWWWLQIAVNPGRGRSNGNRPLNWADVLQIAEPVVGPNQLAFLHLYGSWEESRGPLADAFGEAIGPVRLLQTPLRSLPAADKVTLLRRFLAEQADFIAGGGSLEARHHALLSEGWQIACPELSAAQRQAVRSVAADIVLSDLGDCE